MGRKTTAKDVARAAGVSASTVDRVLNGRGGVDPDKERRVVEWARKLKLDRALKHRSARTLRIAVLIQAPDNPFYAEVQNAFAAANRAYGEFNIQFLLHHFDAGRPSILPRTVRDLGEGHDGLILTVPQACGRRGDPRGQRQSSGRDAGDRRPRLRSPRLCRSGRSARWKGRGRPYGSVSGTIRRRHRHDRRAAVAHRQRGARGASARCCASGIPSVASLWCWRARKGPSERGNSFATPCWPIQTSGASTASRPARRWWWPL